MKINIIGDIAGRYDELMLLLKKMPEADLILSVGDMVDRGPKSKQVLEFFMNTPNTEAVFGNHEEMMVNYVKLGYGRDWFYNGGLATVASFKKNPEDKEVDIPAEFIEWLEQRPLYFQTDDLVVSHAPISGKLEHQLPEDPMSRNYYFIWNRYQPRERQSKFMIYGHNGRFIEHKDDQGVFAMCIDNSHAGKLTGIHWPTMEVFEQDYLPVEETLEQRAKAEQRELTEEEKEAIKTLASCIF